MEYSLIRSRRSTMSIELKSDGRMIVRAPLRTSAAEIERFLREKQGWIARTREKYRRQQEEAGRAGPLSYEEIQALANKALEVIPQKVRFYSGLVGVTYGRITIRNQKTRWGSCSADGNLNFNCLLMLVPEAVQDYVVVHELCHRKEMNHSPRFWSEVERVLPDYRESRKWLKEHGNGIIGRML